VGAELMDHNELRGLLSHEHFSVDDTQIAPWASKKSFRAKDGSDGLGRWGPQWREPRTLRFFPSNTVMMDIRIPANLDDASDVPAAVEFVEFVRQHTSMY
jgi:hypothetical protein